MPPPTEAPAPTETVPPTVEPTPEPTAELTPTTAVLETPAGTAAGSGSLNVQDPPVSGASTPDPEATSGDASPTVEPTVTPQPNTDAVTLLAPTGAISLAPGATTTLDLVYAVTTERTSTSVQLELRRADGQLADGWLLAVLPDGVLEAPATDITDGTALVPGSSFPLGLLVQAPAEVAEAQPVTLHIRSVEASDGVARDAVTSDSPIATLTVTPPTPESEAATEEPAATPTASDLSASDLSLTCTTDSAANLTGGDPVAVACAFRGNESLGGRNVTLSQVSVSAPDGWELSASEATGDHPLTSNPGRTLGAGEAYAFEFAASPAVCGAEPGSIAVRSTMTSGDGDGDTVIDGPEASFEVDVLPPPMLPPGVAISALSFGASERLGDGYAPVTGSLAITMAGNAIPGCAPITTAWIVQVGTTGLSGPGRGNASIPAESITYLGTQSTAGAPAGVTPLAADLPLASGQMTTIAHGGEIGSGGTWNAIFRLDPSSDLPAGMYEGEINVTIINGP